MCSPSRHWNIVSQICKKEILSRYSRNRTQERFKHPILSTLIFRSNYITRGKPVSTLTDVISKRVLHTIGKLHPYTESTTARKI